MIVGSPTPACRRWRPSGPPDNISTRPPSSAKPSGGGGRHDRLAKMRRHPGLEPGDVAGNEIEPVVALPERGIGPRRWWPTNRRRSQLRPQVTVAPTAAATSTRPIARRLQRDSRCAPSFRHGVSARAWPTAGRWRAAVAPASGGRDLPDCGGRQERGGTRLGQAAGADEIGLETGPHRLDPVHGAEALLQVALELAKMLDPGPAGRAAAEMAAQDSTARAAEPEVEIGLQIPLEVRALHRPGSEQIARLASTALAPARRRRAPHLPPPMSCKDGARRNGRKAPCVPPMPLVFRLPTIVDSATQTTVRATPPRPAARGDGAPTKKGRSHGCVQPRPQPSPGRPQRLGQDDPAGEPALRQRGHHPQGAGGRRNTVGDASAEARERQMSTEVSVASFSHAGYDFTVLDCPGSVEFVHEARQALVGIDLAVVVVEPVLERDGRRRPAAAISRPAQPSAPRVHQQDGPLRGRATATCCRPCARSARGRSCRTSTPSAAATRWSATSISSPSRPSAYRTGAPSDQIPLPDEYREREQTARREMLETLADFDDDLMEKLLEDSRAGDRARSWPTCARPWVPTRSCRC